MSTKISSLLFSHPRGASRKVAASLSDLGIVAFLGLTLCSAAGAQIAHFSGSYKVVPSSGLSYPSGVAVDLSGNVYVADTGNNRVVRETPSASGYTQTVVTTSTLNQPQSVATDASGNLYISDTWNNRVLKEVPSTNEGVTTWTETTVANQASNGVQAPMAIAVDSNNAVYIANSGNDEAFKMTPVGGGVYNKTTLAQSLTSVYGIAVDAGFNVYLADRTAGKIYEEPWTGSAYGSQILVQSGLSNPTALAVDASGGVWVADSGHNWIYKDTPGSGSSFTGSSLVPGLSGPFGIAVDAQGKVYVADSGNGRVLKVGLSVTDFGQVNLGASAQSTLIFTMDSATDTLYPEVLTQGATGLDFVDAGTGTCTINGTQHFYNIGDTCTVNVQFAPAFAGVRYGAAPLLGDFTGGGGIRVATANLQGTGVGPQVTYPTTSPQSLPLGSYFGSYFSTPFGLALDSSQNVYVADSGNQTIDEILKAPNGPHPAWSDVQTVEFDSGDYSFVTPWGVAVDGGGDIYVADASGSVHEIQLQALYTEIDDQSTSQSHLLPLGSGWSAPRGVAVDGSGNVYVADTNLHAVKEILAVNGSIPASPVIKTLGSGWGAPVAVTVDGSGNVYVGDWNLHQVREMVAVNGSIPASPVINTLGSGFTSPAGLAVDADGNVYVADHGDSSVHEILALGGYSTVKTLATGYAYPVGIAVDAAGNVYFTASFNSQAVRLDYSDAPSLSFPSTVVGNSNSPQSVTVANIGNAPLTFASVSYPTGFPEASSAPSECSTSTPVEPGGSCTVTVTFTPTAAGAQNVAVVLTEDVQNQAPAVQQIALSGTGTFASQAISFTAASPVSFAISSMSLVATGGASGNPVTFSIVSGPGSLSGLNNSTLTFTGAGTIVVAANQAGNAGYAAAPQVTQSIVVTPLAAVMLTPTSGSTLSSTSVYFTWSSGGSSPYFLYIGTTGPGSSDILSANEGTKTAATVTVPAYGGPLYVALYSNVNGTWTHNNYVYTESGSPVAATMLTPAANSILASGTPTFTWSAGGGVSDYYLYVGTTGVGSSNILMANEHLATSASVTVPTYGVPLYVRLSSEMNGTWQSFDYVYTESGSPVAATMITPAANSTLSGATANFTWTTGGGISDYFLYIGTTGPGSEDVLFANERTATSASVTVPTNGGWLYVRLYSESNGTWMTNDYIYTEAGTAVTGAMLTPASNSILSSATANFTWAGSGVTVYFLYVGTNGAGSDNILFANEHTATSASVTVPTYGAPLYVRLYSEIDGVWHFTDTVYTEAGAPVAATMLTPANASTLTSGTANFTWNPGGGATDYFLYVGTTGVGSSNVLLANEHLATAASVTVPTTGGTLYVRLYSLINGAWQHHDYTYTEDN